VLALGRLGARDALDRLAPLARDSVMGVRAVLTVTLQRLGGPAAARLLGDIALHDPDGHAREMALDALCRADADQARAALTRLLRDADPALRIGAARRLVELATPALIPALTAAVTDDPHFMVRAAAAAALGSTGHPTALAGLRRAQADTIWGVRVSANYALGALGGPDAAAALLEATRDPVHQVRLSAVEALDAMQGR
jgi:HEAT repeat protein